MLAQWHGTPFLTLCQRVRASPYKEFEMKVCSVTNCGRVKYAKGLCQAHYHRLIRGIHVDSPIRVKVFRGGRVCEVPDCDRLHYARGICWTHYTRVQRGKPLGPPIRKRTKGNNTHKTLAGYSLLKTGRGKNGWQLEHRSIMALHIGRELLTHENVHHKNGVRDDNRIGNLELWDTSQPKGQNIHDKLAYYGDLAKRWEGRQLPLS